MSYFQPFLVFLKPVLSHHCCRQAWWVWPEADVCSKAGAEDLLVEQAVGCCLPSPARSSSSLVAGYLQPPHQEQLMPKQAEKYN